MVPLSRAALLSLDWRAPLPSAARRWRWRGKGLQPRSLELLDDLGVADRIIAYGAFGIPTWLHGDAPDAAPASKPASPPLPDRPYSQPLIIPQWRVEDILRSKLLEAGAQPEFGATLTDLTQDETGVEAVIATPTGADTMRASWLVGCDGGRSTVRHLADIAFHGETLETHRMLLGDLRVQGLDRTHWHVWRSPQGFLALCPLPCTDQFQFQASIAPGQDSEIALAHYQRIVAERSGRQDIAVFDPGWMSLWRANIRMVDRYRAGRVFLAGDAAHVHSPAGGQGMNTGLQDACNLGWKLAAVRAGADAGLLDSYQAERLPIAARVLGLSTELMNTVIASGSIAIPRNDETSQLGLGYRDSILSRDLRPEQAGLRAGDRAPDATGLAGPHSACRMFDLLRGPHFTILGFGERWAGLVAALAARFPVRLKGYVVDGAVQDAEGHARAAYARDTLFVIRPDNYVGLATDTVDVGPVVEYLEKFGF